MESGSLKVLKKVKKGITPKSIITSSHMASHAGMETTQFIIMGLGGMELSEDHALETARVLNEINPDQIRLLTIGVKEGSGLAQQMELGEFTLPGEVHMIAEQRLLLENLKGITSHYANHHAVDLLLEVRGQLPGDKKNLLAVIDRFLAMSKQEQTHFILGRRMGHYQQMADMKQTLNYDFIEAQRQTMMEDHQDFETIFHGLRTRII